jgi:uncharacterized protein YdaT
MMFGWFKKKKKKEDKKVETVAVETPKVEEPVVETPKVEEPVVEEPVVEEAPAEEVTTEEAPKKKRKAINHITKHKDGGWQVKKEGAQRALKRFDTQKEAIEFAKEIEKTRGTSFIIHKADGSTRKKTY